MASGALVAGQHVYALVDAHGQVDGAERPAAVLVVRIAPVRDRVVVEEAPAAVPRARRAAAAVRDVLEHGHEALQLDRLARHAAHAQRQHPTQWDRRRAEREARLHATRRRQVFFRDLDRVDVNEVARLAG